ncbi:hypothetical protein WA026_010640 [Henosepilachna vigintioctopunctata]|uniref:BSD domain-containing protein n=1 Tax=Henosepilachna vigintioctopunctata TaxID=420089 RepID=A0AAW1UXA1_9CUCU
MSWFDAAGFANIAKSALKEAQRTIDKALDIKDNNINEINNSVNINSDDFFGTLVAPTTGKAEQKLENVQSSIWGSFTGSFFDQSREYNKSVSVEGLDDSADINSQQFSQSKLVVENNDDSENVLGKNEAKCFIEEGVMSDSRENSLLIDDQREEAREHSETDVDHDSKLENPLSSEKGLNESENLENIVAENHSDKKILVPNTSSDNVRSDKNANPIHSEQVKTNEMSTYSNINFSTAIQSRSASKDENQLNIHDVEEDHVLNISSTKHNTSLPEAITVPQVEILFSFPSQIIWMIIY